MSLSSNTGCDYTPACPAERHWPTCLGLYRTEQEVAAGLVPATVVLEERRERETQLRNVARAEQARYPEAP